MASEVMIITNSGVYELEYYDPAKTVPERGKAYVKRKDYTDDDFFYPFRGDLKSNSDEPGIYIGANQIPEFIEPIGKETEDYIISTHIAKTEPGDMLVILKNKNNIQHVYNESSKLYMPEVNENDNILKRALKEAFNAKEVCIEDCKQGFPDRNAFFNFSSVMRSDTGTVSFLLFDRGCTALNLGYTIILHELDNDQVVGKPLNNPDILKTLEDKNNSFKNPLIKDNSIDLSGTIAVSSEDTFSAT